MLLGDNFTDEVDQDFQNQTMIVRTDGAKTSAAGSVTSLLNSTLHDAFRGTNNLTLTSQGSKVMLNNLFRGEGGRTGGARQSS